jgi:hypothetical protein
VNPTQDQDTVELIVERRPQTLCDWQICNRSSGEVMGYFPDQEQAIDKALWMVLEWPGKYSVTIEDDVPQLKPEQRARLQAKVREVYGNSKLEDTIGVALVIALILAIGVMLMAALR